MATNIVQNKSFKHNFFVLSTLVSKDFKLKYRRSILGVVWSVLNPLLMMVVLSVVFSFMFRFQIENFPLYLILGNILFAMMANSTSDSMMSIIEASPLIKKIRVEKLVFPLEKVLFELVNFAISLVAVAIVMVYYQVMPTANALFLPLLLVYMVIFCTGLGLLLSALAVFFRDTVHLWSVVITAWTYATPLFYPIDLLPPWMQEVMNFNPMYHYVTYFRDIMMWNTNPGLVENLVCLGMALLTFIIGLIVFRKTERKFILYV
ncbi:MAG: ABC transporter permease [Raoultibacter sp.]